MSAIVVEQNFGSSIIADTVLKTHMTTVRQRKGPPRGLLLVLVGPGRRLIGTDVEFATEEVAGLHTNARWLVEILNFQQIGAYPTFTPPQSFTQWHSAQKPRSQGEHTGKHVIMAPVEQFKCSKRNQMRR